MANKHTEEQTDRQTNIQIDKLSANWDSDRQSNKHYKLEQYKDCNPAEFYYT